MASTIPMPVAIPGRKPVRKLQGLPSSDTPKTDPRKIPMAPETARTAPRAVLLLEVNTRLSSLWQCCLILMQYPFCHILSLSSNFSAPSCVFRIFSYREPRTTRVPGKSIPHKLGIRMQFLPFRPCELRDMLYDGQLSVCIESADPHKNRFPLPFHMEPQALRFLVHQNE